MASTHRHPRASRIVQTLFIVSALLTLGCDTATGGGWIEGMRSDRATFGFSVQCRDTRVKGMPVAVVSVGQLDWNDGDVSFHGVVEPEAFPNETCEDFVENSPTISFNGTYTLRQSGDSGTFNATVFDGGEPGPMNLDSITITLTDDHLSVIYANGGVIQEGNIQVS